MQDNSKLVADARAELHAKRMAKSSRWTWTTGYLICILVLHFLGPFWFIGAVALLHIVLLKKAKKRELNLRLNKLESRFSRH